MERREIVLAGGCFWGMQKYLSLLHGVVQTQAGYANGSTPDPTYEEVCRGSGHAEAVRVVYDKEKITLPFLLSMYFEAIDPTAVNHQGGDYGINYRTGIYYLDQSDLPEIEHSMKRLAERWREPIAVEVKPLENYTPAEDYHQQYLDKFSGGYCYINRVQMERAARVRDPEAAKGQEEQA